MKKILWTALACWAAAMVFGYVVAQQPVPFHYWPSLYGAAENLVVKRGVNRDGTLNDKLYFRIGWTECLALRFGEWQTLIDASPEDRYMNMRDYADATWDPEWHSDDGYNCPIAPLEVKPTWRDSRPVYEQVWDADLGMWLKGGKTKYRVWAPDPVEYNCLPYNSRKADGSKTNYWRLAEDAQVYIGDEWTIVGHLDVTLSAVCRSQDIPVEDYRW